MSAHRSVCGDLSTHSPACLRLRPAPPGGGAAPAVSRLIVVLAALLLLPAASRLRVGGGH
jgi:hypothetical protein